MIETLTSADRVRNSAIGKAEVYFNKTQANKDFDTINLVKKLTGAMPIFSKYVAARFSQKHIDNANHIIATSIMWKALSTDKVSTSDEYIKFAKTQKKDSLYV